MEWFNELFDLSAVAGGAGLAGGGGAAVIAWLVRGAILRFIVRILFTAVLTGVGFYFLLGFLGFEIVPKEEVAATAPANRSAAFRNESFLPQADRSELAGAAPERTEAREDDKRIVIKSPFRRGG
ncbi:hypothetical protein [Henriciella litoralis]|uniref:hypothetical protein n=1 Tax=Henriciella litoralis TaxID=568102 RepID=UPI000A04109E|nr:hypothetical protein [Henriciella litoralis]